MKNTLENKKLKSTRQLTLSVDCEVIRPQECYNCGKKFTIVDYYLVVKDSNDNQFLYNDVCCGIKPTDRRFLPSNGTDGMIFIDQFCSNCIHEKWMHHQDSDEGKCEILSNSMLHNRPCYDKDLKFDGWEWFDNGNFDDYPKNYKWKCNQFKHWDWGNDRDRWNEPPEPVPYDPNQLLLFSIEYYRIKQLK